jgi:hypothetical protein
VRKRERERERVQDSTGLWIHKQTWCYSCNFSTDLNTFEIKSLGKNSFHMNIITNFFQKKLLYLMQHRAVSHYQNFVLLAVFISLKGYHLFKWEKSADLQGQGRRESSFKVGVSACHMDATLGEHRLCMVSPGLPYQLPDGYLQEGVGSPLRGCECRVKIRKMQQPQTERTRISLGFSFGWLSR